MHSQPLLSAISRKLGALALILGSLWSFAALAEPGVHSDSLTLGQSTSLSGPLGDLGQEVHKGAKVYFDALNARGGMNVNFGQAAASGSGFIELTMINAHGKLIK